MVEKESAAELCGRLCAQRNDDRLELPLLSEALRRRRRVVEVAGESNVAKSQYLLSACVGAVVPRHLGGQQALAVYVDADDRFSDFRLVHMLESRLNEALARRADDDSGAAAAADAALLRDSLSRFTLVRCRRRRDLLHAFDHLDELFVGNDRLLLVCVDGIGSFDHEDAGGNMRERRDELIRRLVLFSSEHRVAVLVSRHFIVSRHSVTRQEPRFGEFYTSAYMGPVWRHAVDESLFLERSPAGHLTAQTSLQPGAAPAIFHVYDHGVYSE